MTCHFLDVSFLKTGVDLQYCKQLEKSTKSSWLGLKLRFSFCSSFTEILSTNYWIVNYIVGLIDLVYEIFSVKKMLF